MAVTVGPCSTPKCFTRTIGYWQTHGDQLSKFMTAPAGTASDPTISLWGKTYYGNSTAYKPTATNPTCSRTGYDFLWPLCQQGASECK